MTAEQPLNTIDANARFRARARDLRRQEAMPPRGLLRGIMRLVLDALDADEVSLYLETRDLSVKLTEEQRPPLHVAFGSVGQVISAPISLASGDGWIRAIRDTEDPPFQEQDLALLIAAADEIADAKLPDRF